MMNTKSTESEKPQARVMMTSFERTWIDLINFHSDKMEFHKTQYLFFVTHRHTTRISDRELSNKIRREHYRKYATHRRFLILLAHY